MFFPLRPRLRDSSAQALTFKNKGFALVEDRGKELVDLGVLRDHLEGEFQSKANPLTLGIESISSLYVHSAIEKMLTSPTVSDFLEKLSVLYGSEVFMVPGLEVMRNYFPSPWNGRDGWHADAGGEYKYDFCREKMRNGYLFGKIQIPLQFNGVNGGNIDLLPFSYSCNDLSRRRFGDVAVIRATRLLLRLFDGPIVRFLEHRLNYYLGDLPALVSGARTLDIKPLSIFAFHHMITHRGTPICPSSFAGIIKNNSRELPSGWHVPELSEESMNKFMIYVQFGNVKGLASYVYDRSRREGGSNEFAQWKRQFSCSSTEILFSKARRRYEEVVENFSLAGAL